MKTKTLHNQTHLKTNKPPQRWSLTYFFALTIQIKSNFGGLKVQMQLLTFISNLKLVIPQKENHATLIKVRQLTISIR